MQIFFMLYSYIFARIKINFIFCIRIFVHILSLVSVVPHTLVHDQFFFLISGLLTVQEEEMGGMRIGWAG